MIEPKKNIKDLSRTPPSFEDRIGKVYRLDRNERTTPFPKEHLIKILNSINPDEIVAYPELEPFYNKLAKWLKLDRREVLVTCGSDTGIRAVYEVYVEEGDEVVIISPTYGMYAVYCKMFGAKAIEVYYNEDLSLPVERILSAINQNTKMVVIANPNHTGTVISEKDILEIINTAMNTNALVLLDEAYYHFYGGTMLPYINQFNNLIIVRTFSKAFGIAPLRVGYIVSNKKIISQLYKVKLTHEITSFSAKVASYLLDHLEIMNDYVEEVNKGKDVLYKSLPQIGCKVLRSEANFVFFKTPIIDGKKILLGLEKKKIYLKGPFSQKPFSGHCRVTVGSEEQMLMLCDELKVIFLQYNKAEKVKR